VQYADDTLLILPGDTRVLFNLKGLLRPFSDSTGLHVNFRKSFLVPINMNDNRASHLANTFGSKDGSMTFTYLGFSLLVLPNRPCLNSHPYSQGLKEGSLALVNSCLIMEDLHWLIQFSQHFQHFICVASKFHPKSLRKYIFSKSTVCGVKVILIEEVHVLLHGKQPANQKLREAWA